MISAGRKDKAPVKIMTLIKSAMKVAPVIGNEPSPKGRVFLVVKEPASARTGTITKNLPKNMAQARVMFHQGVLADRPEKALPLLTVAELKL